MAHWKDAAVTNEGVEMLNEWMAGRKITVVAAFGGTGTVDPDLLTEQTDLVDMRQELYLLGEEDGTDGKTVQLQVQNADVMVEYELNQVGVYAALDVDKEKDTAQEIRAKMKLLFIMQDEKGVTIPAAMDASFLLELYCMIGITNNGRFEVSVSAAGIVTAAYLREVLERTIAAHNADPGAHNSLAARMLAIETAMNGSGTIIQAGDPTVETVGVKGQHYINPDSGAEFECVEVNEDGYIWNPVEDGKSVRDLLGALGNTETSLADVDARLGLLELMYRTQVNGNPFTVSFSDMSGLAVTGVWNETLKRVEF
nr:hypothetical protein [uncultured Oscillibacter sp.]